MVCGNCKREIHVDRSSCLYCGWTKAEGVSAPTAARPVAGSEDPRTFRAGATTWRFLVWAVAAALAGVILLKHAPEGRQLVGSVPYEGAAVALFVLGPLAFVAQLLRMALVKVTVDPKSGLVLRSGRQVLWQEIEGVEFIGFRFASDQVVIHFLLDLLRSLTSRIPGYGLMNLLRIALMALLGCLILTVATLSGVLLPVMLLLSPWEPRIVVRTRDGRRLVWRDLGHEVDFVRCIERGLRGTVYADQGPLPGVDPE